MFRFLVLILIASFLFKIKLSIIIKFYIQSQNLSEKLFQKSQIVSIICILNNILYTNNLSFI